MRLIALSLVLLPLAAVAQRPAPAPARCGPEGADKVRTERSGPERVRPLNEMPDARPVLAVRRTVDGCPVLLVRDGARIVEEPVARPEPRRTFRP